MLFKFLTGKEIGHLQTGLILSQIGGLILIFMGLMVLLPSRMFDGVDEIGGVGWIIVGVGIIRMLAPVLVGKGSKIAFWVVIVLSVLKLIESFIATVGDSSEHLQFYWYLAVTGLLEIGVLLHLLNPKARTELGNQ
tara:strand:+ start:170 stop:577 length:408 start_codon:yes stop_codon:yes gene_type:complete